MANEQKEYIVYCHTLWNQIKGRRKNKIGVKIYE